jgi:hypothetical protein
MDRPASLSPKTAFAVEGHRKRWSGDDAEVSIII